MLNETSFYYGRCGKKKANFRIIPPSYFKKEFTDLNPTTSLKTKSDTIHTERAEENDGEEITSPKISILHIDVSKKRGGSALSLKSIQAKKELEKNKKKLKLIDPKDLPKDSFSEKELLKYWNAYGHRKEKQGERFLASTFAMHKPKLKEGFIIAVEVPNQGMKVDIEFNRIPLLEYFHKKLNNYSIDIEVIVNEVIIEKQAYKKEDKYKKLQKKNPLIDLLRTKFDLDI